MAGATAISEIDSRQRIPVEFCSWQQEAFVFNERDPYQLFSGAFGAGKTRGLCHKILYLGLKYAGARLGMFRKVRRSIKKTTLETFLTICPPEFILRHNLTEGEIELVNGSRLFYLGLDDHQKIGSLELDFAGVDETAELEEDDWTQLSGRVGRGPATQPFNREGLLFGATNPGTPAHFLYRFFFTDREGAVYETETADNRLLSTAYKARLTQFRGRYHDRYVKGKWVTMEGLVYDCFDPIRHVIEPFEIPGDWPRFRAIDFGYRNPFVCLWFALSPEDEMIVYRQWYMSRRTNREHSERIREIERVYKYAPGGKKRIFRERIEATWADHDADGRATLEENGVETERAEKAVSTGIQEVYDRIADDRLLIFRDSVVEIDERMRHLGRPTSLQEEIQHYALARTKSGQPDKENPIKVNDHACDGVRYGAMGVKDWTAGVPMAVIR